MDATTMRNITNQLEHLAGQKLAKEINKAQSYHDGYVQACEDLLERFEEIKSEESHE